MSCEFEDRNAVEGRDNLSALDSHDDRSGRLGCIRRGMARMGSSRGKIDLSRRLGDYQGRRYFIAHTETAIGSVLESELARLRALRRKIRYQISLCRLSSHEWIV